jgi:hypothetical protein
MRKYLFFTINPLMVQINPTEDLLIFIPAEQTEEARNVQIALALPHFL